MEKRCPYWLGHRALRADLSWCPLKAFAEASICELLLRCSGLRALALRGLLGRADIAVAYAADSCRHLTHLDLRHCSTLSDAGLAHVARLPFLRRLHLAFCVRLTDGGLLALAGGCRRRVGGMAMPALALMGFSGCWPRLLRELELYHCAQVRPLGCPPAACSRRLPQAQAPAECWAPPAVCLGHSQVTHCGIWAIINACPELKLVNVGACCCCGCAAIDVRTYAWCGSGNLQGSACLLTAPACALCVCHRQVPRRACGQPTLHGRAAGQPAADGLPLPRQQLIRMGSLAAVGTKHGVCTARISAQICLAL